MSKEAKWQEVYKVQTAAITELEQRNAELEAKVVTHKNYTESVQRENVNLKAERDRLRAALQEIAEGDDNDDVERAISALEGE